MSTEPEKPKTRHVGESMTPLNIIPAAPAADFPPVNLMERLHDCHEVSESSLIVDSPFERMNPSERIAKIVEKYNSGVKEPVITPAGARAGERIEPGWYLLAHRNKITEIAAGTGERLTLKITGAYTETALIGAARPPLLEGCHRQTDPLVGDYGKYIVNVPQGQLARVWSGNTPMLLNEGQHVILDSLFRAESPMLVNRTDTSIEHGTIRIIRVPQGSIGKVLIDSKPFLLPYRKLPYAFYTPFFKFEGFVLESEPYIGFGSIHLLRVPAGSVAKVWVGSKPHLLEYRDDPYFFDDPLFRLEHPSGANSAENFIPGRVKHIRHGSINRLRPGVNGEVEMAIVQHDGEMYLIDRFITIDDPNQAVIGFVNMSIQTLVFPSRETREERKRENPRATLEEIVFEPMTTRDSLKIGLKLLVAFQISDPLRLLKKLRMSEIVRHVENLAVSDMARAVQNSTSQNFLNSSTKPHEDLEEHEMSITDRVRAELARHLDDCGLKLVRFNIEESKVLDEEISKEMAKQSLVAAAACAQQAVIDQNFAIARSKCEVESMARKVKQDQDNEITITAARAKLEADRITAETTVIHAEAERKVIEMKGGVYRRYPSMLKLEMAKTQLSAMRGMRLLVCPEQLAKTPYFNIQGLMNQLQQLPLPSE
jgi:regulator of protease activity HflC (stomatin/prohibitin superfamily)